jgi:hypothetical protein
MKYFAIAIALVACKSDKAPKPSEPTPAPAPTAAPAPPPPPVAIDAAVIEKGVGQCRFTELAAATELLKTPTKYILNSADRNHPCRIGTSDKSDREISMDLSGVYAAEVITGEAVPGIGEKAGWEKEFAKTPEEVDPALFFQVKGKLHRVRVTGSRMETLKDETIAWATYLAKRMTEIE